MQRVTKGADDSIARHWFVTAPINATLRCGGLAQTWMVARAASLPLAILHSPEPCETSNTEDLQSKLGPPLSRLTLATAASTAAHPFLSTAFAAEAGDKCSATKCSSPAPSLQRCAPPFLALPGLSACSSLSRRRNRTRTAPSRCCSHLRIPCQWLSVHSGPLRMPSASESWSSPRPCPTQSNPTGTLSSQNGNVMVLSRVEEARKYFRTVGLGLEFGNGSCDTGPQTGSSVLQAYQARMRAWQLRSRSA